MALYKEALTTQQAVRLAKRARVKEAELEIENLKQGFTSMVLSAESTWITYEDEVLYINGMRGHVKVALGYAEGSGYGEGELHA